MLGASAEQIISRLKAERVPVRTAASAIAALRRSPAFASGAELGKSARRLLMIVRLQRELRATAGNISTVERRKKPSAEEFFARYFASATPVVFTDALRGWKALRRWSPEYFKRKLGDVQIEATADRDGDPYYDMRTKEHSKPMTMGALADRVLASGSNETNDFYLVANNHAMDRAGMRVLLDDVVMDPSYFDVDRTQGAVSLWFGPRGTVTPLHHDTTNIIFHQVYGKKRFLLISPFETSLLRHARGVYCDLDPEHARKNPLLRDVPIFEVVLTPGDALFIPVGWWHHVRALEPSISISFTNLRAPNNYGWYAPGAIL